MKMLSKDAEVGTLVKVRYQNFCRMGIVEAITSVNHINNGFKIEVRFTDNQELRQYDRWDPRVEEITSPVEIVTIKKYENAERLERDRTLLPR
jgi:hypothetical protein